MPELTASVRAQGPQCAIRVADIDRTIRANRRARIQLAAGLERPQQRAVLVIGVYGVYLVRHYQRTIGGAGRCMINRFISGGRPQEGSCTGRLDCAIGFARLGYAVVEPDAIDGRVEPDLLDRLWRKISHYAVNDGQLLGDAAVHGSDEFHQLGQ